MYMLPKIVCSKIDVVYRGGEEEYIQRKRLPLGFFSLQRNPYQSRIYTGPIQKVIENFFLKMLGPGFWFILCSQHQASLFWRGVNEGVEDAVVKMTQHTQRNDMKTRTLGLKLVVKFSKDVRFLNTK